MKNTLLLCLLSLTVFSSFAQLSEKVGIGVRLQIDSSRGYKIPKVIAAVPNSPAQAAGLLADDFILKVNGQTTRDVKLEDVVAAIVGEEGTEVKLAVERKGSALNFTIKRGKYKYADSYYDPAVKGDAFCTALATLMNDAAYDFANTMDTLHYTDGDKRGRYYACKVKVPGAVKTSIVSNFGLTGTIDLGSFKTTGEVSAAGQDVIMQIKTCFPDYYYQPKVLSDGSVVVQMGKQFKNNGFESYILNLNYAFNESLKNYQMNLDISGGKATRYFAIATPAQDNTFAKALRAIFNDIPLEYKNVKGARHDSKGGGLFSMPGGWYDVSPVPDGAHDCSLAFGGLSLSNGCNCRYYLGDTRDEAVATYTKLFEAIRDGLGDEFMYTLDKNSWDATIPQEAESVVTFGIKKGKGYESGPLLSLVIFKDSQGKYEVNMLFHKFGF